MSAETRSILVVDDEPDFEPLLRRRMRRDVRTRRYRFSFARSASEALALLQEDPGIEMVLSDINMPGMDGLTLIDHIAKIDPNMPAVVVSAYDDMPNIRAAMNRGAFDFVPKPIDFDDLRATIDKTLEHLATLRDSLKVRDQLVALQSDLDVAGRIQESILPAAVPEIPGYEVFGNVARAREVGGDFFDVIELRGGRLGVIIADVSGMGVPAALFMMLSRTLMRFAAIRSPDPAHVLETVNGLLEADNDTAMFVTLFYAVVDPAAGTLQYANGGHHPPLIVHPDGSSTFLPATGGVALGVMPAISYHQQTASLSPGDMAFLYTDGITGAKNARDEAFGTKRLQAVFAERRPQDAQEAGQAVFDAVSAFAGDAPPADDLACAVVRKEA